MGLLWGVRRALRALRAPLRRPLEPLLWVAASMSAKDVWVRPPPCIPFLPFLGRDTLPRIPRPPSLPPLSLAAHLAVLPRAPPIRPSVAVPAVDGVGRARARGRARGGRLRRAPDRDVRPQVRSTHWFPYDRVGVVNADP